MPTNAAEEQVSLFGQDTWSGRTSPERSAATKEKTSGQSSKKLSVSRNRPRPTFHCLIKESGLWQTAVWLSDFEYQSRIPPPNQLQFKYRNSALANKLCPAIGTRIPQEKRDAAAPRSVRSRAGRPQLQSTITCRSRPGAWPCHWCAASPASAGLALSAG